MVAVKAGDVERTLRDRDPARHPIVLVYGPDHGLVSERAGLVARAAVDDASDPFQLIRLEGDEIAASPGRLADEAGTIGLFGARRSILVRAGSRNVTAAVAACLDADLTDTSIVVEAGELTRTAPLRVLCEKSPRALALPCYADNARDLGDVVETMLREHGLAIAREDKTYLVQNLGGDRLASRGEIGKLALYAHGGGTVTRADIDAVVSDVSASALDAVVDAAFAGRLDGADGFSRQDRNAPHQLLAATLRHNLALLAAGATLAQGRSIDEAVSGWRGLHFSRQADAKRHLGLWSEGDLTAALGRVQAAVLDSRRYASLSADIVSRALLDIARQAQSRLRRR